MRSDRCAAFKIGQRTRVRTVCAPMRHGSPIRARIFGGRRRKSSGTRVARPFCDLRASDLQVSAARDPSINWLRLNERRPSAKSSFVLRGSPWKTSERRESETQAASLVCELVQEASKPRSLELSECRLTAASLHPSETQDRLRSSFAWKPWFDERNYGWTKKLIRDLRNKLTHEWVNG